MCTTYNRQFFSQVKCKLITDKHFTLTMRTTDREDSPSQGWIPRGNGLLFPLLSGAGDKETQHKVLTTNFFKEILWKVLQSKSLEKLEINIKVQTQGEEETAWLHYPPYVGLEQRKVGYKVS